MSNDASQHDHGPAEAPPSRPARKAWVLPTIGAVALLVIVGAGVALASQRRGSQPGTQVTTPAALRVYGELQVDGLPADNPAGSRVLGKPCISLPAGYRDIRAGAQVTITDAAGVVLGLGELGPDRYIADPMGEPFRRCGFYFQVGGIPSGRGPYGVEVSHRGVVRFPESALERSITLELGH